MTNARVYTDAHYIYEMDVQRLSFRYAKIGNIKANAVMQLYDKKVRIHVCQ